MRGRTLVTTRRCTVYVHVEREETTKKVLTKQKKSDVKTQSRNSHIGNPKICNYSILSFFQDLKDKMKRVLKEKQKNLKKKSEILAEKVSPREEGLIVN